jgi:hypothetical protein
VTYAEKVAQQKQKLSKVLGRSAADEVEVAALAALEAGGKVTGVRFMGEASMDTDNRWEIDNPLAWDLQITPDDDGSGVTQFWYASLTHVMSETEIRSLFLPMLN